MFILLRIIMMIRVLLMCVVVSCVCPFVVFLLLMHLTFRLFLIVLLRGATHHKHV